MRVAGVRSVGLRTDLAIHGRTGRVVEADDHLIVVTPDNPGFRSGNLLVYPRPPRASDRSRWSAAFDVEVGAPPRIGHRTFTWDGTDGEEGDAEAFASDGFTIERNVVLTAGATTAPGVPAGVRLAEVRTDAEWAALLDLQATEFADGSDPGTQRFLRARLAADRRLVAAGVGAWWAAWDGEALLGTLGIVRIHELARYQNVLTAPWARRRGVARALVHHAGHEARRAWRGVRTLVIEADPEGPAIGLYRRLGFVDTERRTSLCQFPWREVRPS